MNIDKLNPSSYNIEEYELIKKEIESLKNTEYQNIQNQYFGDEEYLFYEKIIKKYINELIPLFLKEYEEVLDNNQIEIIKTLGDRVSIIKKDSKYYKKTAGYCFNQEKVFLIPSFFQNEDIISKLVNIKGILIHEIHHMLTTCKTNNRININYKDNIITGSMGNYMDEGIVELSSIIFANKYNLPYIKSVSYHKNTIFINNIMKALKINKITDLWNKSYIDILSNDVFAKDIITEYERMEKEFIIKKFQKKLNPNLNQVQKEINTQEKKR